MPIPFTVDEKLRVQFRKSLRKGYVRNAQLDPEVSAAVRQLAVELVFSDYDFPRKHGHVLWSGPSECSG